MSTFADTYIDAQFPAQYRDARSGLRFRVVDITEKGAAEMLVTTEIAEGLVAAITWGPLAVTAGIMKTWGVSIDEAMATATANIVALPIEGATRDIDGAKVEITVGHHWVSSLIVDQARRNESEHGFLVAIPRSDVMVTAPVVGAETVDSLEFLIELSEDMFDADAFGISPHVWWCYQSIYRRVTDRTEDGSIDLLLNTNLNAYHLGGAIRHLAHPCAECGRE